MPPRTLASISQKLSTQVARLSFAPPVACVYNPLSYAKAPHVAYLERYGFGRGGAVLLGMNPGPFGMVQTGVPFGDVVLVRDWLGIHAAVKAPPAQHDKRPILGFGCTRREVSGSRFWGWARERFGTPERFFERFFVVNYCPLAFMEASGKNLTPDRLASAERSALFAPCDEALRQIVQTVEARHVVGVGGFAEQRAREALAGTGIAVSCILHPSPANPQANRGWGKAIEGQLEKAGILIGGEGEGGAELAREREGQGQS